MKLLITGATSRIGGQVFLQALANPAVTSVLVLSRRELSDVITNNPKLDVLIRKILTTYSKDVLEALSDADACIWCLGTPRGDRLLELEFPMAFHEAMIKLVSNRTEKDRFRYIHTSGKLVDRDTTKRLWIMPQARRTKGIAEKKFLDFAKAHSEVWKAWIVRPGSVVDPHTLGVGAYTSILGQNWSIRGDELAAFVVDLVVNGSRDVQT